MTKGSTIEEARELLRGSVIPVILDNGIAAHGIAIRIFLKYRIVSLLCGVRKRMTDRINPVCGFLRLFREHGCRLAAEQLADFADDYDDYGDCLFVLIPVSEEDRALAADYAALLESRYILSDPKTLFSKAPFAGL